MAKTQRKHPVRRRRIRRTPVEVRVGEVELRLDALEAKIARLEALPLKELMLRGFAELIGPPQKRLSEMSYSEFAEWRRRQ
jgi:hypothetical protein